MPKKTHNSLHIPQFALYGEGDWVDDPSFIHSEDIASRSSPLGWKIQPHRHNQLYQCLMVDKGTATVRLDEEKFDGQGPSIIWIPPGVVHSFTFSQDTQGAVMSFSELLLRRAQEQQPYQALLPLLSQATCQKKNRSSPHWKALLFYQRQLQNELNITGLGKSVICESLVLAMIVLIARELPSVTQTAQLGSNELFQRFKQFIDLHYKAHWTIEDYADALTITASRLNRLSKQYAQHSAKQLIQQRLIMESKRKLLYTRQTADEIAYDLGFKDPGYFSRFFKRMTGETPGNFRRDNAM